MTEQTHHHDILANLNSQGRALRQTIPEVYRGFGEMSRAALASGALDRKVKELIAMVIGVVHGCDGCIASHAQGAVRAGASKEEAAEAIGVAIMMYGGPATVHGARAYDAFCEFAAAKATV
jgi:AhpD family alkylhydroperoxidase